MISSKMAEVIMHSVHADTAADNAPTITLVMFLVKAKIVSKEVGGAYLWTVWEPM